MVPKGNSIASKLLLLESRLCCDEVQPARGGQIKCIADHRRTRIERGIHFDLRQQFLSPTGAKNGHEAFIVPNVKTVAGQEEASPDGIVRFVLPEKSARCRVQTINRSAHIPVVGFSSGTRGMSRCQQHYGVSL